VKRQIFVFVPFILRDFFAEPFRRNELFAFARRTEFDFGGNEAVQRSGINVAFDRQAAMGNAAAYFPDLRFFCQRP